MKQKIVIKKDTYYDSITLMQLTEKVKSLPEIFDVVIVMGSDSNKQLLKEISFNDSSIDRATSNDLIIGVKTDNENILNQIESIVEKFLTQVDTKEDARAEIPIRSLEYAIRENPDVNLALISVAGEYAALEAKKALLLGKHVFLFSDNVKIEEEIELKSLAVSKGLLMMGPDCGTAIINHIPLGFANDVPPGPIGIIAASGTGSQEVATLITKLGSGITQLIGIGGRDLSETVGGKMMNLALNALAEDELTKVIVLISKPPEKKVAENIFSAASRLNKPVVICFLGLNSNTDYKNIYIESYLENAAIKAVELATGKKVNILLPDIESIVKKETLKMSKKQKYIRGLYSGGTLCDEALIFLGKEFGNIYSNVPVDKNFKLPDSRISIKDTLIDLGEDEFTKGKAHPMIDPQYRNLRLLKETEDPELAIILLDFVLGYGANPDPAGAMLDAIRKAKQKFESQGEYLSIIASVCGTETDPQKLLLQQNKLEAAGVICMPSNLQAVRLAAAIKRRLI